MPQLKSLFKTVFFSLLIFPAWSSMTYSQNLVLDLQTGWHKIQPIPGGSRVIYQNVSGHNPSDEIPGSYEKIVIQSSNPVDGCNFLRDGQADILLFKRGDVFNGGSSNGLDNWQCKKSGRSNDERIIFGAYGTNLERPRFPVNGQAFYSQYEKNNLAFIGLNVDGGMDCSSGHQGSASFLFTRMKNILVEDMKLQKNGIGIQTAMGDHDFPLLQNHAYRRNTITDNCHHGMLIEGVDSLLIEGNLFDVNGWRPGTKPANMFERNLYLNSEAPSPSGYTWTRNVILKDNIFTRSGSAGFQDRAGGIVENNLVAQNFIGALVGGGDVPLPGGVDTEIRHNVVIEGKYAEDFDFNGAGGANGWGFELNNIHSAIFEKNVIANSEVNDRNSSEGLKLQASTAGINDTLVKENIIYKFGPLKLVRPTGSWFNVRIENNDIQDDLSETDRFLVDVFSFDRPDLLGETINFTANRYFSTRARPFNSASGDWIDYLDWLDLSGEENSSYAAQSYPDPARSLASYHQSLGRGASFESFIAEARKQSQQYWRPEYTASVINNYFRAGFGMSAVGGEDHHDLTTDLNHDGQLNLLDLQVFLNAFSKSQTDPADWNQDGIVDISDLLAFVTTFSEELSNL